MCLTTLFLSGIFRHKTYILPPRMLIYLFAGAALYDHITYLSRRAFLRHTQQLCTTQTLPSPLNFSYHNFLGFDLKMSATKNPNTIAAVKPADTL